MAIKDELTLTWKALARDNGCAGWSRMNISSSASVRLMAGLKQPRNSVSLIVHFPALVPVSTSGLPSCRGFSVRCESMDSASGRWICIVKTEDGRLDLFTIMAADIAESLARSTHLSEQKKYALMLSRIKSWQRFMESGRDALSNEEELGLMGELILIEELIKAGMTPAEALDAWAGPYGADQDFRIGTGAVEVKSTLAEEGFPAKIQSLEQLDDSERQPLFVAGCQFSREDSGISLPLLVDRVTQQIGKEHGPVLAFEGLLLKAGYHNSQAACYVRRFTQPEIRYWLVDASFPRLTGSTVPPGVRSAIYTIELGQVNPVTIDLSEVLQILKGE